MESGHSRRSPGSAVERQALATVAGESRGVLIFGIEADKISVLKALSSSTSDDALDKFRLGEGGYVSANLSRQLSIHPGDVITLVHPTGQSSPMGLTPLVIRYRVLGIVDSALFASAVEAVYVRRIDAEKFPKPDK
jgi:ABC-type lipoprotein release transport system permease subunit